MKIVIVHLPSPNPKGDFFLNSQPPSRYFLLSPPLTPLLKIVVQYASNNCQNIFFTIRRKLCCPLKSHSHIFPLHKKKNMLSAQNGKYTLPETENIPCPKRKIYVKVCTISFERPEASPVRLQSQCNYRPFIT